MLELSDRERLAEIEADNRRLRRLLDQQGAPVELRHRLRNTVAMLRAIIRRSAESQQDVGEFAAHLEDRVDALVRAQAAADEHGSVRFRDLIADELFHYGVQEGGRAALSGPTIELEPRAGQVLALAIHELTINAVEHGELADSGRVEIRWQVDAQHSSVLTIMWSESSEKVVEPHQREGFGMEVLTRMLNYEVGAETAFSFGPRGVQWTIQIPLTERVGSLIAAE
jgi:two-component sensor histidine kinase